MQLVSHGLDIRSLIAIKILSKPDSTAARYSSVFRSCILPAGTSSVNECPYNGNASWSGIWASSESGCFIYPIDSVMEGFGANN